MPKVILILLLLPFVASAQTETRDSLTYIVFKPQYNSNPKDDYDADKIDFSKEQPESVFIFAGPVPLKYKMKLVNDTVAQLYGYQSGQWHLQEDMRYESYFLERYEEDGLLHSRFEISDFDNDGDQDLLCGVFSSMNGNMWSHIYLNDQQTLRLVKLNNIEDDGYWVNSRYSNGKIYCAEYGSAFGPSYEAEYLLQGLKAIPLKKKAESHSYCVQEYYNLEGRDGEWKMVSQNLDFGIMGDEEPVLFTFVQHNDSVVSIYTHKNDTDTIPVFQEQFAFKDWLSYLDSYNRNIDGFRIADFDRDGYDDVLIECMKGPDTTTIIFLQDVKNKKLVKLYNTAEDTDVWVNPVYNEKRGTITCRNRGMTSFLNVYKIRRFRVKPISKLTVKREQVNNDRITVSDLKIYKGKNGKWKLIKRKTNDNHGTLH